MHTTEKTVGLAVREHIAAKMSDGKNFCLRDFDKLAKKLKITSTQVRSALNHEVNIRSIESIGKYKPAGYPKEITHYKLINMDMLLRREGAQRAQSAPPLLQAALDAIIHKRMQKKASASRARHSS